MLPLALAYRYIAVARGCSDGGGDAGEVTVELEVMCWADSGEAAVTVKVEAVTEKAWRTPCWR